MKKYDLIVIGAVLFFALCAFGIYAKKPRSGDYAVIRVSGEIYRRLPLTENQTVSINGHNTVTISDRRVWVSEADCPDQLCVHQGKTDKPGKTIVCLPNRMTVEIESEE